MNLVLTSISFIILSSLIGPEASAKLTPTQGFASTIFSDGTLFQVAARKGSKRVGGSGGHGKGSRYVGGKK